jgi:glycerate kinase
MRVVAAADKFRGTATAPEVVAAIAAAVTAVGGSCDSVPLSDGGEGILDAFGGGNRTAVVTGPLGDPVVAAWRFSRGRAVIEMAAASGLLLVGGAQGNDPIAASTYGTGELIGAALDAGARQIVVGVGGSATTDGGLGAIRAVLPPHRLRAVRFEVACDVRTLFLEAAETFGPQKGATSAQVQLLTRRLHRLAEVYREDYGVDVREIEGSGAGGGLAGGLAALGAKLVSGFQLVAEAHDLAGRLEGADLVVTGEGFVDAQSFQGKVVGGVSELARSMGVPVLVIAGEVFDEHPVDIATVSLVERFGRERAVAETDACITDAVVEWLSSH